MKTRHLFIAIVITCVFVPISLTGQNDISQLFKSGATDIQGLAEGYLKPAGYGLSEGLGTNWYNTAATHKLLGFDITVGAGAMFVPTSDKTFSLSGLQALQVVNGQTSAPTLSGKGDGVLLRLASNGQTITEFSTPKGVTPVLPAINAQITIGLPFGNDLSFRFVPNVTNNRYNVGLWGVGIKHNIKQWIPVVKLLPFDASVMIGYTRVHFNYNFENPIIPNDLNDNPNFTLNVPAGVSYDNQGMKLTASSLMANIIVSKRLLFFTPYLGFGVSSNDFHFNFTGNYPVLGTVHSDNSIDVNTLTNPIPLHYASVSPQLTLGFRLKILWVLALHAQYTFQQYPTASAGIGINIR
ncbi:DUF6588 family protein [Microbacter margulisiae]|uniref:Uncharacterized protein n=1 Tax=Microbacter margulisiae TaxID=1350067 RepID=A0A7W5H203_9PORP|nr:DUF6588 family protein [Microbacter margulisiae]MBB3187129.1 hypothetical protein [Microbacter margulisiae]